MQQAAQRAAESNVSDSPAEQDMQSEAQPSASAGDESSSEGNSLQEWETVERPQIWVSLKSFMQAVHVQQGRCLSSVSASVLCLAGIYITEDIHHMAWNQNSNMCRYAKHLTAAASSDG